MNRVYIFDKSTNITYYMVGVKEIDPTKSSSYTEYPIPEGGFISDHVYKDPDVLNFSMISDGFDALKKSYYMTEDGNTVNLSYQALKDLFNKWINEGTQLDIQTVHDLFKNMCLNRVSWREASDSWSKFVPTLSFKEVRIAQVITTNLNALNVTHGASYSVEEETGETSGQEVTSSSVVGGVLADAVVGAGLGAAVGSIIPGVGTAIGAGVGAAAGAVFGFFKSLF